MIICDNRHFVSVVVEQNIVMDSGTARVSDDGAEQGVLRMYQEGNSAVLLFNLKFQFL